MGRSNLWRKRRQRKRGGEKTQEYTTHDITNPAGGRRGVGGRRTFLHQKQAFNNHEMPFKKDFSVFILLADT